MVKSRDFWIGVALGLIAFYVYQGYVSKGGKKS